MEAVEDYLSLFDDPPPLLMPIIGQGLRRRDYN
ncbi:hypothetical protein N39L_37860 [Limnospira platensis NIES-39]|jgi:hypothetical protein|uniref:Uncharacterized protein n=1 Tax=Limnospira platensis NIES-46 TaxID=1236695 RepID=A0A5M3T0E1_LIMPL|nr:hypothetical protein N39L_37860 [Arthrospira platensis NIES-39]GCE92217.1 hypothetical protein NIES46_02530 [Arthrospira platensis NIES-46]